VEFRGLVSALADSALLMLEFLAMEITHSASSLLTRSLCCIPSLYFQTQDGIKEKEI
jgi:hypothetical protein